MVLWKIATVIIFFTLFADSIQAGHIKQAVKYGEDALSGDNPLTEKEVDQGGPSSGKLNEIDDKRVTNTNSIKDEPKAPGETTGQRDEEKETEEEVEKRALPAVALTLLKNSKVQEAVVEKGIEVAGKLVDKQLKIIDEAQEKAEQFLKKEIKLDIEPDKSWATNSLYVPPGYHFQSSITDEESSSSKEAPDVPFVYPAGIGSVMMNGCYGKNYSSTDPCYNSRAKSTVCWNQIDGAAFLGVGFDGRGKYSPESRKMSIVQRNCKNKATYDEFDVPDTMNVHGVYDTSASLYTFQGSEEYATFLQQEAGVSGSLFGFYAGVKEAWGSASAETKDSFLAILDVNIDRYEIFMDEVKPSDLSLNFLREFMELPLSYYSPGAPIKYQDFVQRWGTHYIKSAKFGGQLEIRKTMDKETAQSKTHFSIMMEAEYKSLFASVGASASFEQGSTSNKATETTSTSVLAQGGSHEIASILSDVYSPTFKNEFKHWLTSIPSYPKPFKFRMGPITDLVNFRATDLFPEETVNWGCEAYVTALKPEKNEDGEEVKYYEISVGGELKKKVYCPFEGRGGLEQAIKRRRSSLHRAIETYMEEGTISISDFNLKCSSEPETEVVTETASEPSSRALLALNDTSDSKELLRVKGGPSWKSLIKTRMPFKVIIDMKEDLKDSQHGGVVIPKNMVRRIRFLGNRWFTDDERNVLHLYNGFNNGGSGDPQNKKISVLGLVLSFEEKTGRLVLADNDFKASKKIFPGLNSNMKGSIIGQVEANRGKKVKRRSKLMDASAPPAPKIRTCDVMFSNALRFDPKGGKCLHFTAITSGTIYVMFAVSPGKPQSQYTVRIANDRVDIYKGSTSKIFIEDESAVGIGTESIHQSYFVCVTETEKAVRIEYGKSQGSSDAGDVFLSFGDVAENGSNPPLSVQFYAFGIEDVPAKIMDAHLLPRILTDTSCKGRTREDNPTGLCAEPCHVTCDPTAGCTGPSSTECKACRMAKDITTGECLDYCPENTFLTSKGVCEETFEINGNELTGPKDIKFDTDMPGMSELTVSFWVKLSGTKDSNPAIHLSSEPFISLRFGNIGFGFDFRVLTSGSRAFRWQWPQEFMRNPTWHLISTTWSGTNHMLRVFIDGEQVNTWVHSAIQSLSGGGWFGLKVPDGEAFPIRLTSINVWNYVLSVEVIAGHVKSCDAAIGNIKEWYDAWPVLEEQSTLYTKPTTCSASIPDQSRSEGVTSENDLHQSSGKSLFVKSKKKKPSTKDDRKTHH